MVELIACDPGLSYFQKTEGLLDAICILIRLIAILVYTSILGEKKIALYGCNKIDSCGYYYKIY